MDYKSTLNLPQTEFPMKAGLPAREPNQVQSWLFERTYEKMVHAPRKKKGLFVLHDGPPYANGNIHLGHTLNKVLKDIVIKYKNMSGFEARFVPGWDCHGLPIELGVEKQLKDLKKEKSSLSKVEIRVLCKEYAQTFINKQREQFQRLGIFADWDHPYQTMSDNYVANVVRELGRISRTGNLYKGNKPVYWCSTCVTALADAEIEYHNHTSPSIHVKFYMQDMSVKKLPELEKATHGKKVAAVIWTTTPWTLPANMGISLHPEYDYAVIDTGKEFLIVAEGLKEKFLSETGITNAKTVLTLKGSKFENLKADHPFMPRTSLLILGEHVTLEAGTGLVHTAPGHGVDDFRVGQKYGLEVIAPVDQYGKLTDEAPPYKGIKVFEANKLIIEDLRKSDHLLSVKDISHSYPHCWRCHKPVIFRATPQWFIGMEPTALRKRAIEEIKKVEWIPAWGINRILGMVESRPDWCVSRQRTWGVPITVFYCNKCSEPLSSQDSFNHIANLFDLNGPNVWYEWPVEKLLKPGSKCSCGESSPSSFTKETDILDVWFDSGVSHAAVLDDPKREGLAWPADLYLEGSDQHRGWFQTSLLTAVETRKAAPYKKVLTHGFVNDKEGKKMSKSKGNVTDPMDFASKNGAEILRLWVVIEDYRNDVNFSQETIDRLSESYRKVRNTFRYILGNIHDFDQTTSPKDTEFCDLDHWALYKTELFLNRLHQAYDSYEFHLAYHALVNFCSVELSAIYFDILKDRLYTSAKNSKERRSSQAALFKIAKALVTGLAPILSFTSEEVWGYLKQTGSIFEAEFPVWASVPGRKEAADRIDAALSVRENITKQLEVSRVAKEIGHPLEASVVLHAPKETVAAIRSIREDIARLFIVSKLELVEASSISVEVKKASGLKCARCWVYTEEVGQNKNPELCNRCTSATA